MKNVLIINQSSELYGADKALLELIENFPENFKPIVVLEHEGPLKEILLQKNIQVIKCPVIKLNRAVFTLSGFFKFGIDFFKGIHLLRKNIKNLEIDLIHSNAISVLVGAFYSFLYNKKHLWHVHEIIEHPKTIASFYPKLVYFFSDKIIFNSQASFNQFLKIKPIVKSKSVVVYNGQSRLIPVSSENDINLTKNNLFHAESKKKIIGLVGRISRWKGQIILLEAFYNLQKKHPDLHLVFVGSPPPNQDHFLHTLENRIKSLQLESKVTVVDFQKNIWPVYDALDIVIVPSIEPEPFGLVATEGMLSSKPLIGSNHGGLSEIIVDGETGFLFEPKNQKDLELKIEKLVLDSPLAEKFGKNGYKRVHEKFSTKNYVSSIENIYKELS